MDALYFLYNRSGRFGKILKNGSGESRGHTLQVYRQRCQRHRQTQFQSEVEKLFSNYTKQLVHVKLNAFLNLLNKLNQIRFLSH